MTKKLTLKCILAAAVVLLSGLTVSAQHYLVFASDRHGRTAAIGNAMSCWKDVPVEYVSMIGDMVGEKSGDAPAYDIKTVWDEVNAVFTNLTSDKFSIIWADHDGGYTDNNNLQAMKVPTKNGVNTSGQQIYKASDGSYYIYAINFYEMENVGTDAPEAFKTWVDGIEDLSIPIIVLCHVPMHYSSDSKAGDNLNGTNWCDALNYAATGSVNGTEVTRDVIFLHGHFHTAESVQTGTNSWNPAVEHYWVAGDAVDIQGTFKGSYTSKTLRFTYVTAGYSRSRGSLSESTSPNNATLMCINDDNITFTKSESGTTSLLGTVERVAQETPVVYHTVTFETNGGSAVESQTVEDGRLLGTIEETTREGFIFAGWYADEALITEFDFSQPVTADITVYAKWEAVMAACATPTLEFKGGKVVCSCATEGVTYRYKVELTNTEGETTDGVITIGPAVTVTVRATREGMLDSEPAAMMFSLPQVGDVNGDGSITIADVTALVDIILGK